MSFERSINDCASMALTFTTTCGCGSEATSGLNLSHRAGLSSSYSRKSSQDVVRIGNFKRETRRQLKGGKHRRRFLSGQTDPLSSSPVPLAQNHPSENHLVRPGPAGRRRKPESRPFKLDVKAKLLFSSTLVFAVSPEPRSCTALSVRFRACSTPSAALLPTPKLLNACVVRSSGPVRNIFVEAPGRPTLAVNDRKTVFSVTNPRVSPQAGGQRL